MIASLSLPQENEVHLWRIALSRDAAGVKAFAQSLSDDERKRAERFHRPLDRDRFVVCRGSVRAVLGAYLCRPASKLRFAYGPHGKPFLANEPNLRFNVSHSGDCALLAVTAGHEVGVDIERIQPDYVPDVIAAELFSPEEQASLLSVPEVGRAPAFFTLWTLKEAYVKATGLGLTCTPQGFTISLCAKGHATLRGRGGPEALFPFSCSLLTLNAGPDYAAALAVEGPGVSPRFFAFV